MLQRYMGTNCKEQCPPNCINNHCEIANGYCVWGCDANNCANNKCDIRTGVCIDGCVDGRAGQYCSECMSFFKILFQISINGSVEMKIQICKRNNFFKDVKFVNNT